MPRENQVSQRSAMRQFQQVFDTGMPIMGVAVILAAVLFVRELRLQLAIVVAGIVLVEAGVWKLSQLLLPNDRQYTGLRREGDHFIGLIRQLNEAAIQLNKLDNTENRDRFESTQEAMHQSVDRMAKLAGKTDPEHSECSVAAM